MGINWRVRTKPLAFWLGIAGAAATPVLAYLGLGYEAIPRAWAARGATAQLGTRSERKFGAGGPRRASTWQWLLRWGGIIMNGWPASRGGCCKGSAWEQMQYCVRTFC